MISFKTYLQEKVVKKWTARSGDDEAELLKALKKHCSHSLAAAEKGSILYRGDHSYSGKKYVLIDSSKGTRTSRDTNNIYQLMMETSVHFKDVPKRSTSIIATTTRSNAYSYASSQEDLFVVMPFNGVKIACVPGVKDILRYAVRSRFNTHTLDLEDLGIGIGSVIQYVEHERIPKFTDASVCDELLSQLTSYQFEKHLTEELHLTNDSALKAIRGFKPNTRFTELSNLIMTPDSLPIKIQTAGYELVNGTEYWLSGKSYLVNLTMFDAMFQMMDKDDESEKTDK